MSTNFGKKDLVWYACASSSIVMATASVYLLICVSFFVLRQLRHNAKNGLGRFGTRQGRRSTHAPSASSEIDSNLNERRATVQTVNYQRWRKDPGRWMYFFLMLAFFFNFIRVLEEQLLLFLGTRSDVFCDALGKTMIVLTAITIHLCHVFLWCRQVAFYSNALLRHIRSRKLQAFSYFTYFLMLGTVTSALFLHLWWRDYAVGENGCATRVETLKVQPVVPFAYLACSTMTVQACLTFLFIYPILTHNKSVNSTAEALSTPEKMRNSVKAKSAKRLMKCVKRALVSCTVGISTDAFGALVAIWIPQTTPLAALSVLYECNILLNLLCLLYTYTNWKNILFPFCRRGTQNLGSSS